MPSTNTIATPSTRLTPNVPEHSRKKRKYIKKYDASIISKANEILALATIPAIKTVIKLLKAKSSTIQLKAADLLLRKTIPDLSTQSNENKGNNVVIYGADYSAAVQRLRGEPANGTIEHAKPNAGTNSDMGRGQSETPKAE